jgi:hypothetical protein
LIEKHLVRWLGSDILIYMNTANDGLIEGMIAYVQGYEFVANGPITVETAPDGLPTWSFTGFCTEDKRNNDIRNTHYNGARYSWRPNQSR